MDYEGRICRGPMERKAFMLPDLRHFKIKYNSINRRNAVFFCQIS